MIFVDTSAWYALFVDADRNHDPAKRWFDQRREQLITSDHVLTETLTLLRSRGYRERALDVGALLLGSSSIAILHTVSESEFMATRDVFRSYSDKEWSFTDCSSKVVTQRLGVGQAFAFDRHFRQFGSVAVLP